jgi:hypothetical protein
VHVSGQLHIPVLLSAREQPPVSIAETVLTEWKETILLPLPGIEPDFLSYPAHRLVTIHTRLSRYLEREIQITKLIGTRQAHREYEMRKRRVAGPKQGLKSNARAVDLYAQLMTISQISVTKLGYPLLKLRTGLLKIRTGYGN